MRVEDKDLSMLNTTSPEEVASQETPTPPKTPAPQPATQEPIDPPTEGSSAINWDEVDSPYSDPFSSVNMAQVVGMDQKQNRADAYDAELDMGIGAFDDQESIRIQNQTSLTKLGKSLGMGVASGVVTALQSTGELLDYRNYTNMIGATNDMSQNWWTSGLDDLKQSMGESDAFKIYEEAGDPDDLAAQIFKWSSITGLLDSAVGYGLPGIGATKVISALSSTKNAQKAFQFVDKILGKQFSKGAGAAQGAAQMFAQNMGASTMTSFMYGNVMAGQTYKDIMADVEKSGKLYTGSGEVPEGKISLKEARKVASKEAQDVVDLVMLEAALTSQIRFGKMFRQQKKANGFVESPSLWGDLKEQAGTGAIMEGVQEIWEETVQQEQAFEAKSKLGIETEYDGMSAIERVGSIMTETRTLSAGALGIAGGPVQFALMHAPFGRANRADQQKLFDNQKVSREFREDILKGKLKNINKVQKAFDNAVKKGDATAQKLAGTEFFTDVIANSYEYGTTNALLTDLEKVTKYTPEQAEELGYDSNYKEVAQRNIANIRLANLEILNEDTGIADAPNKGESVGLFIRKKEVDTIKSDVEEEASKLINTMVDGISSTEVDSETISLLRDELGPFFDPNKIVSIQGKEKKQAVRKAYTQLNNSLSKNKKGVKKLDTLGKKLADLQKLSDNLGAMYATSITQEHRDALVAEQTKAVEEAKDGLAKEIKNNPVAKDKSEKKTQKQSVFQKLAEKEVTETPAETDERLRSWDKQRETAEVVKVNPGGSKKRNPTFHSKDDSGNIMPFSIGEVRRTNDGRLVKVVSQSIPYSRDEKERMKSLKDLRQPNVVRVKEVTSKNGVVRYANTDDTTEITIHDFSIFRDKTDDENVPGKDLLVKIPVKFDKTFSYKNVEWTTYEKHDEAGTLLKPYDYEAVAARILRADADKVTTHNFSSWAYNKGKLPSWATSGEYNVDYANTIFQNDVVTEMRIVNPDDKNNTWIDVLVDGEKITRIDRLNNINYGSLYTYLSGKEGNSAEATITGHFQSVRNLNKNYKDGKKIRTEIREFASTQNGALPNDKIYLMTLSRDRKSSVILDQDGNEYKEGSELSYTLSNGNKEYVSKFPNSTNLTPGSLYMMMVQPGGSVFIPTKLDSKRLSPESVDRFVESQIEFITSNESLGAVNEDVEQEIINTKKGLEQQGFLKDDIQFELSKKKAELLGMYKPGTKSNTYYSADNDKNSGVYEFFMPDRRFTEYIGRDNNNKPIESKNKNKNLFAPGIAIDPKTTNLEISPYISVRADFFHRFDIDEKTGEKVAPGESVFSASELVAMKREEKRVYLSSHPELYRAMVATRFAAVDFSKIAGGDVNSILDNGMFTTDINPNKHVVGSSLEITVKDPEFNSNDTLRQVQEDIKEQNKSDYDRLFSAKNIVSKADRSEKTKVKTVSDIRSEYTAESSPETLYNILASRFSTKEPPKTSKEIMGSFIEGVAADILIKTRIQTVGENVNKISELYEELKSDESLSNLAETLETVDAYEYDKSLEESRFITTGEFADLVATGPAGSQVDVFKVNGITDVDHDEFADAAKQAVDIVVRKISEKVNAGTLVASAINSKTQNAVNSDKYTNLEASLLVPSERDSGTYWHHTHGRVDVAKRWKRAEDGEKNKMISVYKKGFPDSGAIQVYPRDLFIFGKEPQRYFDLLIRSNNPRVTEENRKKYIKSANLLAKKVESSVQDILGQNFLDNFKEDTSGIVTPKKETTTKKKVKNTPSENNESGGKSDEEVFKSIIQPSANIILNLPFTRLEEYPREKYFYGLSLPLVNSDVKTSTNFFDGVSKTHKDGLTGVELVKAQKALLTPEAIKESFDNIAEGTEASEKFKSISKEDKETYDLIKASAEKSLGEVPNVLDSPIPTLGGIPNVKVGNSKVEVLENLSYLTISDNIKGLTPTSSFLKDVNAYIGMVKLINNNPNGYENSFDLIRKLDKEGTKAYPNAGEAGKSANQNKYKELKADYTPKSHFAKTDMEKKDFLRQVENAKRMLPNVPLYVVSSVADLTAKFGVKALGAWNGNVRYVVRNANKDGVAYHETFHAVAEMYLTQKEKSDMAAELGYSEWNDEVEEIVADKFAEYSQTRDKEGEKSAIKKLGASIKKFFEGLMSWFRSNKNNKELEKIFGNIYSGKYAPVKTKKIDMLTKSLKRYKNGLSPENKVTLENLLKSKNIIIKCK